MDVLKRVHPRGISTFRAVEAVETPDPLTAVFKLSEPAPYMLMALSGYESPMLPKHIFGTGDITNHPNANKPIGTGPFKFVEWQKGQYMRFDRNPDYWKPGPPVSRPDRGALHQRRRHARRRHRDRRSADRRLQLDACRSTSSACRQLPADRGHVEGLRDAVAHRRARPQHPQQAVRQRQGAPGDRLRDRPQVHHRQRLVRLRQAGTGPISSNFKANGLYTADVHSYVAGNGIELANKLLDEAGYPKKADGTRFEDHARHHAVRRGMAPLRRSRAAAARQGRHQGEPAL